MAAKNFNKALAVVLQYEGGYSDHPSDPGGPTNRGVIQRVYDGYRRGKGLPPRSVRQITTAEVHDIYRRQYWAAVQGDRLPAGVDLVVFDGAVNSGPSQAAKWLQRALGVRADGDIGEATLAAAAAHPDHDALIAEICRRRLGMLRTLRTWPVFGRGWSRRVASVMRIGQAWAAGAVAPKPDITVAQERGNCKGSVADVALPPASEESGVNTGAAGGGAAATVAAAKDSLEPVVGASDTLNMIYAALVIAGVVLAVAGLAYWWWAKRRRQAAERAWSGEAIADLDPLMAGAQA